MPFSYERKSIFAALPRTERARAFNLGGDPKGKNFLYTNDTNVFIRDIENPSICDMYSEHGYQTSVAKYSPSGYYIASGDITGKLRIWDTTQKEHILKNEYQPISGKISDIAWDSESKRIAVCGEGREKFAAVILWDSGSSVGSLKGNTKNCNAIDIKPTRPFRLVVASEDMSVAYYEGVPYKLKKTVKEHSNFVNTTKYSPDGNFFVSGGSDGKVFLYSGKEGELVAEFKDGQKDEDKAHKGGVYSVFFSSDSKQLITGSGDKTVKLWDVETQQLITTFTLGQATEDQQLSVLWQGDYILSTSLSGYINYLDKNNPDTPLRILRGHNKNISTMTLSSDTQSIYAASLDNKLLCWDADTSECDIVAGNAHTSMVTAMSTTGNTVASIGMDDKIRFVDTEAKTFTDEVIGLDKQPLCISAKGDLMAVGTVGDICLFKNKAQVCTETIGFEAKAVHLSPTGNFLAVGGSDSKLHIFDVSDDKLKEIDQLTAQHPVSTVQFSSDAEYLACTAEKAILLWKVEGFQPVRNFWCSHGSRITSLQWNPENKRLATSGIDSSIGVWDVDNLNGGNMIRRAHQKSVITALAWRDNTTIVSTAQDKCIMQWTV